MSYSERTDDIRVRREAFGKENRSWLDGEIVEVGPNRICMEHLFLRKTYIYVRQSLMLIFSETLQFLKIF